MIGGDVEGGGGGAPAGSTGGGAGAGKAAVKPSKRVASSASSFELLLKIDNALD